MEAAPDTIVTLEYTVRLADGRPLDSTSSCGPVVVMIGAGQLFPALEDRILGMRAGETREFVIPPEEAYGPWDPALVRMIPRDRLSTAVEWEVGQRYRLKHPDGPTTHFRVLEIGAEEIRADFNDPNAGQTLHATVTVVHVRAPTPEEERRGRAG